MTYFTAPVPTTEETTQPAMQDSPRTLRLLVASLQIDNPALNLRAINDLIAAGGQSVPFLIDALANPTPRVWRLASVALVKIGPPAAPPLVQALEHENEQIRLLAAAVLKKIDILRPGQPGYHQMWYEYRRLDNSAKGSEG